MPTTRVLRGVLCNFLGTYTSRYTDYDGYWLFGFLTRELSTAELDLLTQEISGAGLIGEAHQLAVDEFMDQLGKSGLDRSRLVDARLLIERGPAGTSVVNDQDRGGWSFQFLAAATTDAGRRFECSRTIFLAPHDPGIEWRSARAPASGDDSPRVRGRLVR